MPIYKVPVIVVSRYHSSQLKKDSGYAAVEYFLQFWLDVFGTERYPK